MALLTLPQGDEKRRSVQAMFDRIAPRYDALNRLLSLGLDQRWRRLALAAVEVGSRDRVVDVACGTGDFAELAAGRGAAVIGVDFASAMLAGARRRRVPASLIRADASQLPLPDACATVVTCGFALRNFVSLPEVFREMARVLAPGGRLALLEVDRPAAAPLRQVHSFYFDRVVPRVGGWLSDPGAYTYLPRSTAYLPRGEGLRELLEGSGFSRIAERALLLGSVQLVTAARSDGAEA